MLITDDLLTYVFTAFGCLVIIEGDGDGFVWFFQPAIWSAIFYRPWLASSWTHHVCALARRKESTDTAAAIDVVRKVSGWTEAAV